MLGDSDFNLYRIWLSSLNREVVLRQVFMEQYSENFPPLLAKRTDINCFPLNGNSSTQ